MITFTPDPPVHGQPCLLCMNGATMPADITIKYVGAGTMTVKLVKFCEWFTPPDGQQGAGMTAHDESGQCNDESRIVA